MTSLEHLSNSQKAAVLHDDGPAAVYAGPGSGKTRVVTLRAARLAGRGKRLLVTTFTNDATEEMRARLGQLLTKEQLRRVADHAPCTPSACKSSKRRGRSSSCSPMSFCAAIWPKPPWPPTWTAAWQAS